MATSLTGTFSVFLKLLYDAGADTSTLTDELKGTEIPTWTVSNGTALNQGDLLWHDQRTLTTSTSEDLDLAGSLTNSFGTVVTFARIKLMAITAAAANGALIQVGGAASNQFINWVANSSDIINVHNNGGFVLWAPDAVGYEVTAGTGDLLKINNTDATNPATYDIYLMGASA
ncbi:MAG: hypothetical protein GY820_39815 [Gammaproteobacteria bacterium]|nr:hypothetical protein [Gammaproteobacteria bacterium]